MTIYDPRWPESGDKWIKAVIDIIYTESDLKYKYKYCSMGIRATHLMSTITFDVTNWPGRHLWRWRGCHRVWRKLTDVNSVVRPIPYHQMRSPWILMGLTWPPDLTPKCVEYSKVVITNRQIKQTLAVASAQWGHLNVPTCVFPAGKNK